MMWGEYTWYLDQVRLQLVNRQKVGQYSVPEDDSDKWAGEILPEENTVRKE
jgi:hypothetical protein